MCGQFLPLTPFIEIQKTKWAREDKSCCLWVHVCVCKSVHQCRFAYMCLTEADNKWGVRFLWMTDILSCMELDASGMLTWSLDTLYIPYNWSFRCVWNQCRLIKNSVFLPIYAQISIEHRNKSYLIYCKQSGSNCVCAGHDKSPQILMMWWHGYKFISGGGGVLKV